MEKVNVNSVTWEVVVKHSKKRLSDFRNELEQPRCEERRSDEIRGAIEELKELLDLAEDKPTIQIEGGYSAGVKI